MTPNYYKLFGLGKDASQEEIKKRYRELAKKYHPDVNKSPDATERMQEIQEAYYILNDQEARSRYDTFYDHFYSSSSENKSHKSANNQEEPGTYSKEYVDPILERWIANAKKQAIDFVNNTVKDTGGITSSGLKYLSYGCVINIVIFIVILIMYKISIS